jgi:hypothetical protein
VFGCLSLSIVFLSCAHKSGTPEGAPGADEHAQAGDGSDRSPAGSYNDPYYREYNRQDPYYNNNSRNYNNDPRYRNDPRYNNDPRYRNDSRNYNNDPRYRNDPRYNNDPRYRNDSRYNDPRYDSRNRNDPYYDDRNYDSRNKKKNKNSKNYDRNYGYGPDDDRDDDDDHNNGKHAKNNKKGKNDHDDGKNYKWYDPKGGDGKDHKLGMSKTGCNLDQLAGISIGGGVGVLEVLPRILKNGSISGSPQMSYGKAANGQLVQSMIVDLRADRALLAPYYHANGGDYSDLQNAINEAASGALNGESSYQVAYAPRKATYALNSAMSFINGNYTTSTVNPKHNGHVLAATLAAIMATIDYPGCSDYFIGEASKVIQPEYADYLNDFPFGKIREARNKHTIVDQYNELAKRRTTIQEDIGKVDELLAKSEKNNGQKLKQVENELRVELQSLKTALAKFPACQKVLAYEMAIVNPMKKTEDVADSWVTKCREALDDRATELSTRLLAMKAENEVLTRQNEVYKMQMDQKPDEGAKKILQAKIDANTKKMTENDVKTPKVEFEQAELETYRAELPLRGSDPPSSVNLTLDRITKLSEESRKRHGNDYFNEDHQRLRELQNDYSGVTRDYVTLGIFGGAQAQ